MREKVNEVKMQINSKNGCLIHGGISYKFMVVALKTKRKQYKISKKIVSCVY